MIHEPATTNMSHSDMSTAAIPTANMTATDMSSTDMSSTTTGMTAATAMPPTAMTAAAVGEGHACRESQRRQDQSRHLHRAREPIDVCLHGRPLS
jgi:hypothetical protein